MSRWTLACPTACGLCRFLTLNFSFFLPTTGVLGVNNNNFSGTIRDGFNNWTTLDFADFSANQFTGTLPSTIFDIPTIRILYFNGNRLTGTLPANWGNSPSLRDLFLSGNGLSGAIPEIDPGQLQNLNEFLVEENQFSGSMPASVCALRGVGGGNLEDLWADCSSSANPRLECDVPECCTLCFP